MNSQRTHKTAPSPLSHLYHTLLPLFFSQKTAVLIFLGNDNHVVHDLYTRIDVRGVMCVARKTFDDWLVVLLYMPTGVSQTFEDNYFQQKTLPGKRPQNEYPCCEWQETMQPNHSSKLKRPACTSIGPPVAQRTDGTPSYVLVRQRQTALGS